MFKVEGSNLGTSIMQFGLFQFSKWLCLDKINYLGILVALLVLKDVYEWTMATQFSFEYCIDPKYHKSEEDIKAICSLQESSRHVL